jgi:hypothetical protein
MAQPIIIVTSQAPDAKPVVSNVLVTQTEKVLISVPQYEVPELIFGGSTVIENGVAEVISPLILCNISGATATVDVRAERFLENSFGNRSFYFVRQLRLPAFETIALPLNGQFFKSGDELRINSDTDFAVNATISFTLGQSEEDDV